MITVTYYFIMNSLHGRYSIFIYIYFLHGFMEFLFINIYMLFAGREVHIGKNCAQGLEYGPRPQAKAVLKTPYAGSVWENPDRSNARN